MIEIECYLKKKGLRQEAYGRETKEEDAGYELKTFGQLQGIEPVTKAKTMEKTELEEVSE